VALGQGLGDVLGLVTETLTRKNVAGLVAPVDDLEQRAGGASDVPVADHHQPPAALVEQLGTATEIVSRCTSRPR
jgi:ADP-ribosylglycohydrolase